MAETAVDSLLKNLEQLTGNCKRYLIGYKRGQLESLHEDIQILRPVLKDLEEKRYEHDKVQESISQISNAASRVEAVDIKLFNMKPFPMLGIIRPCVIWIRFMLLWVSSWRYNMSSIRTAVNSLLKNLEQLTGNCKRYLIGYKRGQLESLHQDIQIRRPVLEDFEEKRYEHDKDQKSISQISNAASRVEAVDIELFNMKPFPMLGIIWGLGACEIWACEIMLLWVSSWRYNMSLIRPAGKARMLLFWFLLIFLLSYLYTHYSQWIYIHFLLFFAFILLLFAFSLSLFAFSLPLFALLDYFPSSAFSGVTDEIKAITVEVMDIYDQMCTNRVVLQQQPGNPSPSSRANDTILVEDHEIMVGFQDKTMALKEQLIGGKKQLEVVSIVGMPGLGKTTLARKLYNDPYMAHHFYLQAWTYVSQVHRKRDLLVDILLSVIHLTDKIKEMSDENLGERLYKRLKGKRYLIVLDDIWSVGAWDDIRIYLPNDNNGSKVIFTSRLTDVALLAKSAGHLHYLRFLTEEESWELLREKVFQKETCPPELVRFGKQITKKCDGLPLAIVVMAGLLAKNDKTEKWWKHVAGSVSSYIVSDPNLYMNTLALSYEHLPCHLKPCFLYLGAFRDDREIPVWKLILLCVAEGFIQPTGQKSLENIAEDYLMDLADRSLLIVTRRRSNGRIKSCRTHDLLRDLCLRKATEFNFLEQRNEYTPVSSSSSNTRVNQNHRLCIHSNSLNFDDDFIGLYAPVVRSFLCFGTSDCTHFNFNSSMEPYSLILQILNDLRISNRSVLYLLDIFRNRDDMKERKRLLSQKNSFRGHGHYPDRHELLKDGHPSMWLSLFLYGCSKGNGTFSDYYLSTINRIKLLFDPWFLIYRRFKLLRVLDLWCLNVVFTSEILLLVHLRYLAIQTDDFYVLPPSISNLSNLETLILVTRASQVIVPDAIWNMVKLHYLYSKGGQYHIDFGWLKFHTSYYSVLQNLQAISYLCPCGACQSFLGKTPNLKKFGLRGNLISLSTGCLELPDLCFLSHLETLKLENTATVPSAYIQDVMLPTTLKSLTLGGTRIKWEDLSVVWMLPNLEVLKLEINSGEGPLWETIDGGFHRLRYLRFKLLAIEQWITTSTHFPSLQHLVVENCVLLEELPSVLGDILTLQVIEVKFCSPCVDSSARKIKTEQESIGNNQLKIMIDNQECSGIAYEAESSGSEAEEE